MQHVKHTARVLGLAALIGATSMGVWAGASHGEGQGERHSEAQAGCEHAPFAGKRHKAGMRQLMGKLDLTEQQQAEIKALRETQHQAMKAERQKLHSLRKEFRALAEAGASEAELAASADQIAGLMSQQMVAKTLHMRALRERLTAEQQAKLAELKAERRAHKGHKSEKDGQ
ncbi:Spy/CpxP family protein refolding chaperone [Simiduia sp. 21SJ11W-1]|uniref:Spy/CpxP family protein refolding chaperone n=1 Tax=Simiduia sp. 21SJ11W-1 TaxID=2909669 RepID=UPI0020A14887|nr:Spy/CpxP family protein refolding chaperone [Simiduia sp. 21SJ11W-1]UTA49318.1 Spy/CpxP family protein refolding chaperone [Simiduia sp. 21SJ11W-1]